MCFEWFTECGCGTENGEWIIENSWRNRTESARGDFSHRSMCRCSFVFCVTLWSSEFQMPGELAKDEEAYRSPGVGILHRINFIVHSLIRIFAPTFSSNTKTLVAPNIFFPVVNRTHCEPTFCIDEPFHGFILSPRCFGYCRAKRCRCFLAIFYERWRTDYCRSLGDSVLRRLIGDYILVVARSFAYFRPFFRIFFA